MESENRGLLGISAVGAVIICLVLPLPSLRLDRAAVADSTACIALRVEEGDTECPEL